MGRHSIPDPEDSADEPEYGHVGESGYEPEQEQAEHEGYEQPGYGRSDRRSDYTDDFDERPGYQREQGYPRAPGYQGDPGYPAERGYPADRGYPAERGGYQPEPGYQRGPGPQPDAGYRSHRYIDDDDGGGYLDASGESDYPDYSDSDYTDDYADEYSGEYSDDYADEYSDDDPDLPTAQFSAAGPPPPPASGPRRQHGGEWDGGEWTGSHRAVASGRRGVSVGVIVALVTVVVVVAGVIMWQFFGNVLSDRSDAAAARCVDGELGVAVIADPTISSHIEALANTYNESASPVGDRCVKVRVQSAESDRVVSGFANTWPDELGDRPALWIPSSGIGAARLEATAGAETVSDSRSLVTSPVLLAVSPQLKDALGQQNWSKLPELQSNPAGMNGLRLPGWGTLKLALPTRNNGDSAYLAAEAVAAASAPSGAPATAGMSGVNTLLGGQPKLDDSELGTALDALLNASKPADAPVHAVATTEQQLFQRAAALSDAKDSLAGWLPQGPTAVADYPAVLLAGDWLEQEQVTAASEFARYLRKPEQLSEFAKAGFRAEGANPPASDVTEFGPVGTPLSVENSMRVTLANATTAPVKSPTVTIMLDQSMTTEEGGKSRLANVVAALNSRIKALPVTSEVGLWTFDGTEGRSEVALGPLAEPVSGRARSELLNSTLEEQSASDGGAVSFTTLRLVYTEAMDNYKEGSANSILVITTGPHTDRSLDGAGLREFVRDEFDAARPVAVNVIDFGGDSDRATWEAVAQASGGSYQNVSSSASPELTTAITTLLS
ncbi:substrate-binding domain-containing protein [Mycolicibacterium sp. XJ870]